MRNSRYSSHSAGPRRSTSHGRVTGNSLALSVRAERILAEAGGLTAGGIGGAGMVHQEERQGKQTEACYQKLTSGGERTWSKPPIRPDEPLNRSTWAGGPAELRSGSLTLLNRVTGEAMSQVTRLRMGRNKQLLHQPRQLNQRLEHVIRLRQDFVFHLRLIRDKCVLRCHALHRSIQARRTARRRCGRRSLRRSPSSVVSSCATSTRWVFDTEVAIASQS